MRKRYQRLLAGVLGLVLMTGSAMAAEITPSQQSISLSSGQTVCTFDLSLTTSAPFAGAEFGLAPSADDVSLSVEFLDDVKNESTVKTAKDGVLYFGFFSGTNKFEGKTYTVARITCTYTGSAQRTVTLASSKIVTVDETGNTTGDTSSAPFTVTLTRETSGSGGGTGGGGGGISVTPTYTLTFATNGGSAIPALNREKGSAVSLDQYVPTRTGYTFSGWYTDAALTQGATAVKLNANTTVYAKWTQNTPTPSAGFTDVASSDYFAQAVQWAVDKSITTGTSTTTFSPYASCTRAQMVTFLWRTAGSPTPTTTNNPFTDVASGEYYYNAVLWAVEKGITKGTSDTTFSPNQTVTRGQTVTFLYRYSGAPAATGTNAFTDVASTDYYADAVQWAVNEAITTGTSATTFHPNNDCTRGQIVTFLYRAAQ